MAGELGRNAFGAHLTKAGVDGCEVAHTCQSESPKLEERIRLQSALRDELALKTSTVYIECADGKAIDCGEGVNNSWVNKPTSKQAKISDEVSRVLEHGSMQTSLNFVGPNRLFDFLSGSKAPSAKAPMRQDRIMYWETVTRPFESRLIQSLSITHGVITNAEMMQAALAVTDNDRILAILIMANFTKNMAAIERRQIAPESIDASVRNAYAKPVIDRIFNRIEGLSDDPSEKYNKEGAIYHFYGAMFAASQIGPFASAAVFAYNHINTRWFGVQGSRDRVKDENSTLGVQFWWGLSLNEWHRITEPIRPD
jgi:hypothetical protein